MKNSSRQTKKEDIPIITEEDNGDEEELMQF
jgi:hypothetical protein